MRTTARIGGLAALLLGLASCGGNGSNADVGVVPGPLPSATPTPSPAPTPTPTPTAEAEPYVIGSLTYSLAADIPTDKIDAIRDAMDFAISHTNAIAAFSGNVPVVYSAGTPTADAGYRGQIRFGGSIGRRVALHELAHWLGSGSVSEWAPLVVDRRFTGALANARVKAFDGPDAVLNADGAHFWPYGLNYDSEFSETQRNTQMVSAQVADMRLGSDAAAAIAGTRRLQNRSSGLVLQNPSAETQPMSGANAPSAVQQWRIAYADGFVTLQNVETGRVLASTGVTGNDAPAGLETASGARRQSWELLPVGQAGWFLIRNRETGNCLDNIGNLAANAPLRLWSCGFHPNQQWRLIR